mgnify:CR=1 FL=1
MSDARQIEADIYERLSKVIDPELGRSVTDLGMPSKPRPHRRTPALTTSPCTLS